MSEADRRDYPRIPTREKAILLLDGQHREGDLVDLSAGGARVALADKPEIGRNLVLFADEFGRLEGQVVRHSLGTIGLTLKATANQRASLLDKLSRYGSRLLGLSRSQTSESQRLFLETLAIAGRVAALRAPQSQTFWSMVEDCGARGWVSTHPISPGVYAVELTRSGAARLRT